MIKLVFQVDFHWLQNVMRDVINDLKWCRQNVNFVSLSEVIGVCVLHATSKECTNTLGVRSNYIFILVSAV